MELKIYIYKESFNKILNFLEKIEKYDRKRKMEVVIKFNFPEFLRFLFFNFFRSTFFPIVFCFIKLSSNLTSCHYNEAYKKSIRQRMCVERVNM